MKKILLIITLLIGSFAFAQPGGKMRERIKSQKIAFITERLSLSSEEAQQFWPIYNAFEKQTERIRFKEIRPIRQKIRQNPNMSDTEANKLLDQLMVADTKMYDAKKALVNDLKSVLPAKKIIKLKAVEDDFNKKLLERLREFREQRQNRD